MDGRSRTWESSGDQPESFTPNQDEGASRSLLSNCWALRKLSDKRMQWVPFNLPVSSLQAIGHAWEKSCGEEAQFVHELSGAVLRGPSKFSCHTCNGRNHLSTHREIFILESNFGKIYNFGLFVNFNWNSFSSTPNNPLCKILFIVVLFGISHHTVPHRLSPIVFARNLKNLTLWLKKIFSFRPTFWLKKIFLCLKWTKNSKGTRLGLKEELFLTSNRQKNQRTYLSAHLFRVWLIILIFE